MNGTHGNEKWKLLVVEDDPDQAYFMRRLLAKEFSAVVDVAPDMEKARGALDGGGYDVVVTDFQLPDGSGLELLEEITGRPGHPPVILVTGRGDEETAAEAFRLRASGYVVKDSRLPVMIPEIVARTLNEASLRKAEEQLRLGEQNQRALLDATPEALLLIDGDGVILTINETGARRLGGTPEKMAGTSLYDHIPRELAESRRERFREVQETALPVTFEDRRGELLLYNVLYPVYGEDGGVNRVAVFSQDITSRRKAEDELLRAHDELEERVLERTSQLRRANEELLKEIDDRKRAEASLKDLSGRIQEQARVLDQILSASPQHFYLFDGRGKFIYASKAAADMLGREQSDFAGKYWRDLGFPDSVMTRLDVERENVLRTGEPWEGLLEFPTSSGMRTFEYILSPITRPGGRVDTVVATARDVTERTRAREDLAAWAAKLREQAQLLDLTHETIVVRDATGTILFWNAGAEEMLGWKREEAVGKNLADLLKTEYPLPVEAFDKALLDEGRWEGELVLRARDGARIDVLSRQVVRWGEGRSPEAILEIDSDVSEGRALQLETRQRVADLERLAHLLDMIPSPVIVTDMNNVITFWSAEAHRVFGWSPGEAVGRVAHDLLSTTFSKPIADVEFDLLDNGSWSGDLTYVTKDGESITGNSRWVLDWDPGGKPRAIIELVC